MDWQEQALYNTDLLWLVRFLHQTVQRFKSTKDNSDHFKLKFYFSQCSQQVCLLLLFINGLHGISSMDIIKEFHMFLSEASWNKRNLLLRCGRKKKTEWYVNILAHWTGLLNDQKCLCSRLVMNIVSDRSISLCHFYRDQNIVIGRVTAAFLMWKACEGQTVNYSVEPM